ncbi:MAG: peptidylprolyl isomerase [Chloroflexi bacterium]|nr:MAG: peptidylprolyl isomerase [Chloroflexota bacterium]
MTRAALALLAAGLLLGACDSGGGGPQPGAAASAGPVCQNPNRTAVNQLTAPPALTIDVNKAYSARLDTARGSFTIQLNPHAAPQTVNNFVYLAQQHYYNCLTFHRIVPGFVAQGGDPNGDGSGGPPYKLPNETNPTPWKAGSVGMASNRAGVSGSQFFVVLADGPNAQSLATSGVYNQFGTISDGFDVVLKLQMGDQINSVVISSK